MGKLKEKIIVKGIGVVVKSQTKKQLEKILPTPIAKEVSKKVGKGVESITSMAMDAWNKFKK